VLSDPLSKAAVLPLRTMVTTISHIVHGAEDLRHVLRSYMDDTFHTGGKTLCVFRCHIQSKRANSRSSWSILPAWQA